MGYAYLRVGGGVSAYVHYEDVGGGLRLRLGFQGGFCVEEFWEFGVAGSQEEDCWLAHVYGFV